MAILFTADTHFYHTNVIKYCHRSFRDVDEMNETLIKNWNRAVNPYDHVYHLGDFGFGNKTKLRYILDRLNGKIHLIRGNHDNDVTKELCASRFEWIKDYYYLKIEDTDGPDGKHQPIILFHYPIQSWNHINHFSWHIHGHTHGNLAVATNLKRHDVGVDNNNMRPVTYERLKEIMSKKELPTNHNF